ncbi:MAG: amino acid racemase [Spirochaetaceae bacterium]|jgi:aspartate racemase|nr:amino acid racemase [Spirochaetaceae bacterium]
MEKVGILGGMGPESTVDYYKNIISGYRTIKKDNQYPQIFINSINMTEMLSYVVKKDYPALINLLVTGMKDLQKSGADFAVIASNTPHVVFDEVNNQSPIPLISIVDSTIQRALDSELKKLLLIGTGFTMKNTFYQDKISKYDISVVIPSELNQEIIHNIIFPELEEGIIIPEKKTQMIRICNEIINRENIDGVILGCTELPLMIGDNDLNVEVLNTTQNHVDAIVKRLVNS